MNCILGSNKQQRYICKMNYKNFQVTALWSVQKCTTLWVNYDDACNSEMVQQNKKGVH